MPTYVGTKCATFSATVKTTKQGSFGATFVSAERSALHAAVDPVILESDKSTISTAYIAAFGSAKCAA